MNKQIKITEEQIKTYQRDGVVLIKGLFDGWVDEIRSGIEHNMREPGPYAAENLKQGESGRFFDDYCNWTRIPEFEDVILTQFYSSMAQLIHHTKVVPGGNSGPLGLHNTISRLIVECF